MKILDLNPVLVKKLQKFSLTVKLEKAKKLFEENPRYPSLHTELLEPKQLKIYSFRIDRKFRAHFVILSGKAKIIEISSHYQ